jgi:hypothetical protein
LVITATLSFPVAGIKSVHEAGNSLGLEVNTLIVRMAAQKRIAEIGLEFL